MPWHIEQGGGTCGASEWAVIKDADGSTAGCHPSKAKAAVQLAALYANEGKAKEMTDIRQLRAAFAAEHPAGIPAGNARSLAFPSRLEARMVERDGEQRYHVHGSASAYEQLYEMWDVFGPYKEGVRAGAGALSLAAKPDVAFLVNHRGMTMARTVEREGRQPSLELAEGDSLNYDAYLNPRRQDVRDLIEAINDGHITESSFAFRIEEGVWNDDYTEYWIERYDINRGDVSAVNYGANPYTSVAARSREIMSELDLLPAGAARAALERLSARQDITPPEPPGRSVALELALLRLDES